MAQLLERLGLDLDPDLLAPALAHRSWCAENAGHASNERLEFLGDAVLGMVITSHVYEEHPELDEGALTDIRKTVVSSVALAEAATELGLGEHLLLGRGEERSGGREKPSILADALEAVIGATYVAGGLPEATTLVLNVMGSRLAQATLVGTDHKSRLQELSAQLLGLPPRYEAETSGPDHARTFRVIATIAGQAYGHGEGRSKKQAEQEAARAAIDVLLDHRPEPLRETHDA